MTAAHDVAVVGAGPAGAAAAYYLARAGLDTLLLDKAQFPRDKTCGDGLTPRALAALDDMGILEQVIQHGCRVDDVEITAPGGGAVNIPVPGPGHQHEYMHIIPRLILDDLIRQRAVEAGAAFRGGVEVNDVRSDGDGVQVQAGDGPDALSVRARLAVVATGASLRLLRRLGLVRRDPAMMVAARAYFEDMPALDGSLECHFDGVALPGYGWVFPLSASSANVGAGVIPVGLLRRAKPIASGSAFRIFTGSPSMRPRLESARQIGPVKGYPIRVDFDQARTYSERLLLVGEAAGLANPLTGEGIDYALESGRIAAEHAAGMLTKDDVSASRLAAFDRELRGRFQRTMVAARRLGDFYLNPFLLNRLVRVALRDRTIRSMIGEVTVGNRGLDDMLSPMMLLRVAFAL